MLELDTETKTILHYAKKIKEYCNSRKDCESCKLCYTVTSDCYFDSTPNTWQEVDFHE